ncbi:MAG: STAS domain-containing protein [Actinomycetota bacterium]
MAPLRILPSDVPRTVCLAGDLDAMTAPAVDGVLARLPGHGDIRLDLSRVYFLGSDGIRLLVGTCRALEGRGRLLLVNPSRRVLRTLRIAAVVERVPNMVLVPPAPGRPGSGPTGQSRSRRRPPLQRPRRPRPDPLSCDDESIP